MMKALLTGIISLVAVCRLTQGGESAGPPADSSQAVFRLFTDFGALGSMVLYFIWQKKRDEERDAKREQRWHDLDRELMTLVRECTHSIAENTGVLTELRRDVWKLIRTHRPRDTDIRDRNRNG